VGLCLRLGLRLALILSLGNSGIFKSQTKCAPVSRMGRGVDSFLAKAAAVGDLCPDDESYEFVADVPNRDSLPLLMSLAGTPFLCCIYILFLVQMLKLLDLMQLMQILHLGCTEARQRRTRSRGGQLCYC